MRFQSGVTDQYIYFCAVDATDFKTRETGLSSFTVYRSRNGGAAAAFTTPTVNETDTTNMPGVYELLLDEDMTIDAGDDSQAVVLHITQASMAPVTLTYELYRPIVTAGSTITVANGCADADIERLQGSAIATPTVAGVLEVDVTHFNGSAGTFASGRPEVNTTHAAGTAWGSGAITAVSIATGAITNAKFAAGAIDAAALAADASAEIADAVWDEDATGHQTQGTFGQAIGDPVADTNTIYKAVVTDATGATVGVDVVAIKAETVTILADTNELQTDWANGGRLDNILDARASQASVDTIDGIVDSILVDTAEIGVAGAGLTNINLPDQTMDITGNLSGSVGSVTGAVGSVTGNVGGTINGLTAAAIKDFFDTDSTTTYASAVAGSVVKEIADNAGGASLTVQDIVDGVFDEAAGAHTGIIATGIPAIKAKTDSLTFTVAGQVDANAESMNATEILGTGTSGDLWRG